MRGIRGWTLAAGLIGLACGLMAVPGCGGESKQSGTMVQVDLAKEKAHQDQMSQFYGPAKKAKK